MRPSILRESNNSPINNSKFIRGDTENIKVRIMGQGILSTNFSFKFTAKVDINDPDASSIISKTSAVGGGITIAQIAPNMIEANIAILSNDTSMLLGGDELYYDIQMTTTSPASVRTLEKGKFKIEADITQDND